MRRPATGWVAIGAVGLLAVGAAGHLVLSAGSPSGSPIPAITIADVAWDGSPAEPTGTVPPADPVLPAPTTTPTSGVVSPETGPSAPPTTETPAPAPHASDPHPSGSAGGFGGTRVPAPEPSRAH